MTPLLAKLNAQAKLTETAPRSNGDSAGFLVSSQGPASVDALFGMTTAPDQDEAAQGAATETESGNVSHETTDEGTELSTEVETPSETDQLRAELSAMREEIRANRRGFHQANALDNDLTADALAARESRSKKSPDLSEDAQSLYAEAKKNPAYLELLQHVAREAMRSDPEFVEARTTQQREIQRKNAERTARLEREATELQQRVPAAKFTREVVSAMQDILAIPRFANESLENVYFRVTGEKAPPKRVVKAPPPKKVTTPVSARTSERGSPGKTRDIHEAFRRGQAKLSQGR